MFYDCVIDEKGLPVGKNDTPVVIFERLKNNGPWPADYQVYVGESNKRVSVNEYLENFEKLHWS
jgi:hypothetical protein